MEASISKTFPPERIEQLLAPSRRAVEETLVRICAGPLLDDLSELAPVVRYSVLSGGKRFRGLLVCAAFEAVRQHEVRAELRPEESDLPDAALGQGTAAGASELAAAVEMVHAYSLVHDDLPCMDNDDVRRGRPSAHRKFDVPLATAAGVAMVPLAVRICHAAVRSLGLSNEDSAAICAVLLRAAGAGGMIAGQVLDLEGEGRSLQLEQLERVHAAKTGALIAAAARMGAMAAGADNSRVAALGTFGEALGLVFQITDDLLDVTETTATLGKTAGRDVELQKSTYPALLGEESARELAATKADEAVERLRLAGAYTPVLGALASYVVGRRS